MPVERVEPWKTFHLAQELYLWPRHHFDEAQQRENHCNQNGIDGANRHDSKLLEPTIAVAERQWMNGDGKIRRCFEGDGQVVDFYLYLPAAFVTVRALIREARARYRWDTRPTTGRLK